MKEFKFKKLNAKLIYRLFDFDAYILGDEIGLSTMTSLFFKNKFYLLFWKNSLFWKKNI